MLDCFDNHLTFNNMGNKKHLIILSLFILFLGCNSKDKTFDELTMGVLAWPGASPVYIADEKGFFEEEGIKISIKLIENYDSRRAALVSGQIDLDYNTMDQLLIYHENNFNAKAIAIGDQSTGGDGIVAKKEIKTLQDLIGKEISYGEATPSDFFLRYLLKEENIRFDQVKFVPVADPQIAGNTIIAEQVDAGVTYEPWLTKAIENPDLHILETTKNYPYLIPGFIIANGDKVEKNKQLYARFIKAWFKAIDFYYQYPDEAKEIMARRMEVDKEEVDAILETITLLKKNQNDLYFDASSDNNMYELCDEISVFWKDNGFITKDIESQDVLYKIEE